ncbi:MAG: TetR/AcrR family transcriptional regulator [Myxococcota bacterium]
MSLREAGKIRRRTRILDAARACLREEGAAGLSTKAIARRAEVSVATLYNLFGSKEEIVAALMSSTIDGLRERFAPDSDAIASDEEQPANALAQGAIDEFDADAFFYRELIRSIEQFESRTTLDRVVELGVDLGEPFIARLIERGDLMDLVSARVLAHQIFMSFVHALRMWASELTDTAQFRVQVDHAMALTLAGVANDPFRQRLHERLTALDAPMEAFSRAVHPETGPAEFPRAQPA